MYVIYLYYFRHFTVSHTCFVRGDSGSNGRGGDSEVISITIIGRIVYVKHFESSSMQIKDNTASCGSDPFI